MVPDGTGSVYDDTGWYLISISWYCLILGGTGSVKGLKAVYIAFQKVLLLCGSSTLAQHQQQCSVCFEIQSSDTFDNANLSE